MYIASYIGRIFVSSSFISVFRRRSDRRLRSRRNDSRSDFLNDFLRDIVLSPTPDVSVKVTV